MQKAE